MLQQKRRFCWYSVQVELVPTLWPEVSHPEPSCQLMVTHLSNFFLHKAAPAQSAFSDVQNDSGCVTLFQPQTGPALYPGCLAASRRPCFSCSSRRVAGLSGCRGVERVPCSAASPNPHTDWNETLGHSLLV